MIVNFRPTLITPRAIQRQHECGMRPWAYRLGKILEMDFEIDRNEFPGLSENKRDCLK